MSTHGDWRDALTTRQRQIAELVSTGLSNKRVARVLGLTEGTVKVHLAHIYSRHRIANRTELGMRWLRATHAPLRGVEALNLRARVPSDTETFCLQAE